MFFFLRSLILKLRSKPFRLSSLTFATWIFFFFFYFFFKRQTIENIEIFVTGM